MQPDRIPQYFVFMKLHLLNIVINDLSLQNQAGYFTTCECPCYWQCCLMYTLCIYIQIPVKMVSCACERTESLAGECERSLENH